MEQIPGGHCSEVWAVVRGPERFVLKIPLPHSDEASSLPTLQAFSKVGGVQVIAADEGSCATLLEHILPGNSLPAIPEDDAIEICAKCILRLRGAGLVDAPRLATWIDRIKPDGRPLVDAAAAIKDELLQNSTNTLLHADLHHSNILQSENDWVVIDPKGPIGDKSFEIAAFMRNPLEDELTPDRQAHRLLRFSELLGDPMDRLWGWSFCEAVMDALWSEDDRTDPSRSWRRAETLWSLRHQFR